MYTLQARIAKKLGQENMEVPSEVVEWFDRCRVSLLAALEESATKCGWNLPNPFSS
jgi:hypothetical protein